MDEATCTAYGGTWDGLQCVLTSPPTCPAALGIPALTQADAYMLGGALTGLLVLAWVFKQLLRD